MFTETISEKVSALADLAYRAFTQDTREPSGEKFYKLTEDAPEWVGELVKKVHGERWADDWMYSETRSALGTISDAGEDADADEVQSYYTEPDTYYSQLTDWLANFRGASDYVDQADEEGLNGRGAGIYRSEEH